MQRNWRPILGLLAGLLLAVSARATKPCPPSPCEDGHGLFDPQKCKEAASWIALGTLEQVEHHPEPPPLAKDFAHFTLRIQGWEKGAAPDVQSLSFAVGWCQNGQELPKDTSGVFRFYGTGQPGSNPDPPAYLGFERVVIEKEKKPGVQGP